jgi:lipopolysaccharide transport system ATP-binding protein
MYHVQKLCRHALWLKDGHVECYGPSADVTQAYLAFHEQKTAQSKEPIPIPAAAAAGVYAIRQLEVEPDLVAQRGTVTILGEVFSPDGRTPVVLVGVVRADGTPIYGVTTDMDHVKPHREDKDRFSIALTLPKLALLPGKYIIRAHALDPEGVRLFDTVERTLVVTGETRELGLVRLDHEWAHTTLIGDDRGANS